MLLSHSRFLWCSCSLKFFRAFSFTVIHFHSRQPGNSCLHWWLTGWWCCMECVNILPLICSICLAWTVSILCLCLLVLAIFNFLMLLSHSRFLWCSCSLKFFRAFSFTVIHFHSRQPGNSCLHWWLTGWWCCMECVNILPLICSICLAWIVSILCLCLLVLAIFDNWLQCLLPLGQKRSFERNLLLHHSSAP